MTAVCCLFLVSVFPACSDGSYGLDCMSTCGNCSQGDVCDKVNGVCPGGCQPGFDPTDGLCKERK